METTPRNPLVALTWMVSTLLGATVVVSLLIVVLIDLDHWAEPVPAEDAHLAALFTDEDRVLTGPGRIAPGRVALNVVNATTAPLELAVCYFRDEAEWMREQYRLRPGEHTDVTPGDLMHDGQLIATVAADPGSDITTRLTLATGFYVFDWVDTDGFDTATHVWRIGAIEVTS